MKMKKYLISFPYNGGEYGGVIEAESFADAEGRLAVMSAGRVDGELMGVIPCIGPPALGMRIMNLWCRWKNRGLNGLR